MPRSLCSSQTATLSRSASFELTSLLSSTNYRRSLFLGSIPPHQATVFSPRVRSKLNQFNSRLRLSADLDYFLRLRKFDDLQVQTLPLELVHMSEGGVSAQHTSKRLSEVIYAYFSAYGIFCFLPIIARYIRRIFNLLFLMR